ncbi:hypothetical protein [Streptomyces hokutonensis]|uniref:hypothetical protein n=1 Tax=Streptomyces hokutonensis TaxID=1306990 RepID=UPI003691E0BE
MIFDLCGVVVGWSIPSFVNGAPHQQLVVHQAEPASPMAAAFESLRALGTEPKKAGATAHR